MARFPKALKTARVCACVIKALQLKILTQPIGILVVGPPAGQKTTALRFFKKMPSALWLDDFSAASFVSHKSGAKEEELAENDLLPKLKDCVLIAPEFASVLEGAREQVAAKLGRLTRIMDGDGFKSASGAHGIRGYEGRHDFVFLAASVPPSQDNWDVFVRAGARFLFVNSVDGVEFEEMLDNADYLRSIEELQDIVGNTLYHRSEIPTLDQDQKRSIFELAKWVAKLRGVVSVRGVRFNDGGGTERTMFQTDQPIVEAPPRLYSMFCVVAQGYAALYNKVKVDEDDLHFLYDCAMDCGRYDRVRFLFKMPTKASTVKELAEHLHISTATIRRKLAELSALGLVKVDERYIREVDKPAKIYTPLLFDSAPFTKLKNHQLQLTTDASGLECADEIVKGAFANNKADLS